MNILSWIDSHISLHEYDDQKEERANAATHGLGVLLSIAAIILTMVKISPSAGVNLRIGMLIFTASMLLLYSASTLYHLLPAGVGKKICRVLDHSNIYFLIAGTYTPIMVYIGSSQSMLILALVWSIAFAGTAFTLIFWDSLKVLHIGLYLSMGWMIVFFWNDIVPNIPENLLGWIIAGGITYTVGVAFYAAKRLPFYHAIWHLFVLGGSVCFYVGFYIYLI
jgi:hemolysin III